MADDKKKLDWEVKPMYNGLSLGFGSKVILSNEHLTAEIAEKFANEHPKGLELFTKYPDDFEPKAPETDRLKELKKLNREQLNEIYGEGAETFANKGEIIAAIIASEETED